MYERPVDCQTTRRRIRAVLFALSGSGARRRCNGDSGGTDSPDVGRTTHDLRRRLAEEIRSGEMERSGSRGAFNRHGAHLRVSRAAIREERPDAAAGFRAGRLHRAGAVRCATVGGADRGVRGGTEQQSGDVSRVRCGGVDAAGRGVGESDERAGRGVCDRGARAASYGGDSGEVSGVEGVGIRSASALPLSPWSADRSCNRARWRRFRISRLGKSVPRCSLRA